MAILTFNQKLLRRAFLLLTLILTCVVQSHADDFTYQGITYTILGNNTCFTKAGPKSYSAGNDVSGDIIIPETVYDNDGNAYTVTSSIGMWGFYCCKNLTSVTIPNSVTSIENYAFWYCTELTSVSIGNSVTSIGSAAFRACTRLTSIDIPNSVTLIGDYGFFI